MKYQSSFLIVLAFLVTQPAFAQKKVERGHLKMEMTNIAVEKPEMEQMVQMMKGSTQEIFFDQEKQQIDINMMGGMLHLQVFQNLKAEEMESYMDMMGNKIKTVMGPEEVQKQVAEAKAIMAESNITYDDTDVKSILGYTCRKAKLDLDTGNSTMKMTAYVTDQVKVPQTYIQNLSGVQLEGTPMEITLEMPGVMTMTYSAVELKSELPANFFVKPQGAYTEMKMEDLKKMGLGGNLGF